MNENNIPSRIHLYDLHNILRPRGGTMQKESLGLTILERLLSVYEDWTDPEFGDNPDKDELYEIIKKNLQEEVNGALEEFTLRIIFKQP